MQKKAKMSLEKRHNLTGWAFLIPAALLIFIFCFYPMVQALILSFSKKGTGGSTFVGLANYQRILKDKTFQQCLFNTVFYFIIQVPVMLVLALGLAQLLNNPKIKGKGIFRTLIFLPCATSLVSYSMIFKSLFAQDGLVNNVITAIGFSRIDWFQNAWAARWVIILALIWRWTGYNMVFYLAGLQNIDYSVYEASYIDGATPFQQFLKITVPLLKPTILLTAIMSTSGTLQLFDESVNLTAGGPGKSTMTLAHYIYNISFVETPKFNYAAALSVFILVSVAILSAIQMTSVTKVKTAFSYVILILASFLSAFPLYYMICGATNTSIDIVRGRLLPGTHLLENFQTLIATQNLGRAMFNSFRNAIIITVVALLVCSIAGYGFEIYHDKGKDILMSILLLAMMLPFVAIMIPLFKMFSAWKLVNTWIALALPSISTPFLIMMFRQAARSFPHDIIEASRLEGLSEIKIFFTMFLPIMKSTYGAAMTVTFMNAWNNYLWPTIILQDKNQITMPMLVANLKSGYSVDYGMLMLGVLICTLPTAVIFLCLQKSFANGIAGAVK